MIISSMVVYPTLVCNKQADAGYSAGPLVKGRCRVCGRERLIV